MTTGEKLLLGLAACLLILGTLIFVGAIIGILEQTSHYSVLTDLLLASLLGLLPIAAAAWLIRRIRRQVVTRREARLETTVLRLAAQHNGVLTVMDVVVNSTLSVDQAKRLLDQLNLKGVNDIHLSEQGIMTYTFRM
ncbi:MAG: hypothetical protein AB7N91_11310 [Candidatus Tectimicrobiota bacterium]